MTADELFEDFKAGFPKRKFSAGLLIAMVNFLRSLDVIGDLPTLTGLLEKYPQQTLTNQGKRANTLIVKAGDRLISLRPFYNEAETYFRVENKRFDYPNCAPHATQAWGDYRSWFDALLAMTPDQVVSLEQRVREFVLAELRSHAIDPSTLTALPRRFTDLLESFSLAEKGEPAGAAFQGMVYAYIRADAPHLHLEVAKVGAGSKRLQRVGDIDGWDGERLALSAEVKSYHLDQQAAESLDPFSIEVQQRKALGIVAALSFEDAASDYLRGVGVRPVDLDGLRELVELWDTLKQEAALSAFTYYVHHIEKNKHLIDRLGEFTSAHAGDA
jgi:hypothetical protein